MNSYQPPIDPGLLGTFLAVADVGKIAAAARTLHLSQPAVTAQIRRLESEMKAALFVRSVQGVRLTPEGRRLYEYARQISLLLREAASPADLAPGPRGTLTLAASTTIGNHLLPAVLKDFTALYPEVSVSLQILSTDDVIEKVRAGEVALGLVEGLSRAPGLRLQKLIEDEIHAVVHPELKSRIHGLKDLGKWPILWRERGSGSRRVIEKFLQPHFRRRDLSFRFELGSTEAIKWGVMNKWGIGFLSRWSIQQELDSGRLALLPLGALRIRRSFSWVFPSGGMSSLQREFVRFTTEHPTLKLSPK